MLNRNVEDEVAELFEIAQQLGSRYRDTEQSIAYGVGLAVERAKKPRRQSDRHRLFLLALMV